MFPTMLEIEENDTQIEALFVLPRTGGLIELVIRLDDYNSQWIGMALLEAGLVRSTADACRKTKKGEVTVDGEVVNIDLRVKIGHTHVLGVSGDTVSHTISPQTYSTPDW